MYCRRHDLPVQVQVLDRQTGHYLKMILCPVCFPGDYERLINEKTPEGKPNYKTVSSAGIHY